MKFDREKTLVVCYHVRVNAFSFKFAAVQLKVPGITMRNYLD